MSERGRLQRSTRWAADDKRRNDALERIATALERIADAAPRSSEVTINLTATPTTTADPERAALAEGSDA